METKRTNKDLLVKGIKTMLVTALLMFIGPTLIYIALGNKTSNLYWVTLVVGILICIGAVFLGFRGLKTIMKSMFD